LERLFIQDNAHYILTMDYHYWKNSNERQQMAKLFDALMDIQPEPTESGLKLKKREADVTVRHAATLAFFGAFDEDTLLIRDAFKNVSRRLKDFVDDIAAESAEPTEGESAPETEAEPEPASKSRGKPAVKK
jgi:hypothetical protein